MNKVILALKWLNYILVLLALITFLYTVIFNISPFGIIFPAYFIIFAFSNLIVLSFVNKASGNPTFHVFKDWALFLALITVFFIIILLVSIIKK
jgi:hypothetical protein